MSACVTIVATRFGALLRMVVPLLLALTLGSCTETNSPPDFPGLRYLDTPLVLAPFVLLDQTGAAFSNANLKGGWSIAFFGYTHCPDICPTTMATLAAVRTLVQQQGLVDTRFIFFSVDPYRDQVAPLKAYLDYFNKDFIGVTGDAAAVHGLAQQVGAFYDYSNEQTDEIHRNVVQRPPWENYTVNHTAAIFFFDDRGRLRAYLAPPHEATKVMEVYHALRRHS